MKRDDLLDLNEAVQNPGKRLNFSIKTHLDQEEDLDLVAPLVGEISAISTGNILLLSANVSTRVVVECARCNGPIEQDLVFTMEDDFDVEGVPSCYGSDGFAKIAPEPEPEPLFQNNMLIRDVYLRQGLLVNLPVQPLCEFGWEGDCPNARELPGTSNSEGHPAFEGLQRLKMHDGENG